jgi:methionyl-tRNA formyltransferase
VDWPAVDAPTVTRMIRAYDPWPGAYTTFGGRLLKILAAEALDASAGVAPGHVLARDAAAPLLAAAGLAWPQLLVACHEGVLLARRVQPEGKRPMDAADFVRGQRDLPGARLGERGEPGPPPRSP